MSDYTVVANWVGLDSLLDTDPNKVISGSLFETEFTTIQTAITTKQDTLTIKDEDDMSSDSETAVASQQSIKAYVDDEVLTTRKYRGTRTILFTGSEDTTTDISLDFPAGETEWDYFDELVFFVTDYSSDWLTIHRADVLDIIEASSLTTNGKYLIDARVYWQFGVADKTVINTVGQDSIIKKIVGIKYE